MTATKIKPSILLILVFLWASPALLKAQNADKLPVREYTNPEEAVTFDRSVSFSRVLDVMNEFSKKYRNKMIVDRTNTEGSIGISIPTMHWMDALNTILRVKQLKLIEDKDFYEIVPPRNSNGVADSNTGSSGGGAKGEDGPTATLDTREVRINAIFFEGNRRALQEIGVDWSTLTNNVPGNISSFVDPQQSGGGGGGGGGGGDQGNGQLPSGSFDGPFVNVNTKGAQDVSQNVFNSIINFGEVGNSGIRVQALFSAFEADNLGEILASPSVKVVDGEEGRIQVGQDFSIKQRDFAGNVVEEFFSVGTILTVTPEIITQNDTSFIHLNINAERSSAQPDPVSTIINKQQAETQSLLLNGEATILAGLYRTEKTEVRRGIPILKDLPPWFFGLRYLFGYNSKDYQMRELVILVQASLEPSVPQRYGKELDDKFEILQGERERMLEEMDRGEQILNRERPENNREEDMESEEEMNVDVQDEDQLPPPVAESSLEDDADHSSEMNSSRSGYMEESSDTVEKNDMESEEESYDFASEEDNDSMTDNQEDRNTAMADNFNKSTAADKAGDTMADDKPEKQEKAVQKSNTEAGGDYDVDKDVRYYIIGGSFGMEDNAVDMKISLENNGYNSAIIQNGSSMFMVTYGGYKSYSNAASDLKSIKGENQGAWLYVNR